MTDAPTGDAPRSVPRPRRPDVTTVDIVGGPEVIEAIRARARAHRSEGGPAGGWDAHPAPEPPSSPEAGGEG